MLLQQAVYANSLSQIMKYFAIVSLLVLKSWIGTVGRVGRCQVVLENEISNFIKLVSLKTAALTLDLLKHSGAQGCQPPEK